MLNLIEEIYSFENSFKIKIHDILLLVSHWVIVMISIFVSKIYHIAFLWYFTKYKQDPIVIAYLIIISIITVLQWKS